jgi:hypothetical protein
MPHEHCADIYKEGVLDGRLVLDWDEKNDRVRIIPGPLFARQQ